MSNEQIHNSATLKRILTLKDYQPFILFSDDLSTQLPQFEHRLLTEWIPKDVPIIHVSVGNSSRVTNATSMIHWNFDSKETIPNLSSLDEAVKASKSQKVFVLIDNLNFFYFCSNPEREIVRVFKHLISLIQKFSSTCKLTIASKFHTDFVPESSLNSTKDSFAPSLATIIQSFFQTQITIVSSSDYDFIDVSEDLFLHFQTRKKSLLFTPELAFVADLNKPSLVTSAQEQLAKEAQEERLLQSMSTFNLFSTDSQKLRKQKDLELPYLNAQKGDNKDSSAIVYQFEKDDDYDEEDPFEEPF